MYIINVVSEIGPKSTLIILTPLSFNCVITEKCVYFDNVLYSNVPRVISIYSYYHDQTLFFILSSNINYIHGGFENNVSDLKKLMVNHYSHKFDLLRPKCCKTHNKPHNNIARKSHCISCSA
jgi:hypothetical protein